jgi:ribonuclease HI
LCGRGLFLGEATNNVAEYTAVCRALEAARQVGAKQVIVFSDSELLVKQLNNEYRVKSEQLRPLFREATNLLNEFENWRVEFVRREENKEAD